MINFLGQVSGSFHTWLAGSTGRRGGDGGWNMRCGR